MYEAFIESFLTLPIAAVVNDQLFCVHGGLSKDLKFVKDIDKVDRFQQTPQSGLLCDLLWSDPADDYDKASCNDISFATNSARGCSTCFSFQDVCSFLNRNNLLSIVRAHELQFSGFRMYKSHPANNFPSLITIFSAPNYTDTAKNKGAVLIYDGSLVNVKQFSSTEHPYCLPDFHNAFTWSLPYIGEKITQTLLSILAVCSVDELAAMDIPQDAEEKDFHHRDSRRTIVRHEIMAIGRLSRYFKILREEKEKLWELKSISGKSRLPLGLLNAGPPGISEGIHIFSLIFAFVSLVAKQSIKLRSFSTILFGMILTLIFSLRISVEFCFCSC